MTVRKYTSRSQQTTLSSAVTSGATVLPVTNASTLFAGTTISAGQTFTIVIDPDTALEEICEVTSASSNNLTVTRAVDMSGASAQDHSSGAVIRHMIIGRDLREANLHIEATGAYNDGTGSHTMHGLGVGDGVVVGTTATQTLTNKTLTSPTITNPNISGAGVDASIVFEGATADDYETTLTVVEPTQDNTITLPNTTGTVTINTATQTLTNKTLTSPTISGTPVITGLSSAGMVSTSATPKDYVDSILGSATAASTSAASAATSASSAATSANSAATSASLALTSANSAATSATAAATSASSAATSATAAATSAASAATSATAAATSASSASASAITAAASVATISSFATTASNSAAAAATSATSAAASATAAATSAASAATSATAAATSASSSLTSANSAATSAASAAAAVTSSVQLSTVDAKGDLIVGTANDTVSRLAAGTNGYILSANSGTATGLEWVASPVGDITAVTAGTGLSGGGTSGDVTVSLNTSSVYVVPAQTGNTGKYLTTDGSSASWGTVSSYTAPTLGTTTITSGTTVSTVNSLTLNNGTLTGTLTAGASSGTNGQLLTSTGTGVQWAAAPVSLPSQTGNDGKLLTTNGTTASWAGAAPVAQTTEPTTLIDGLVWMDTDGTAPTSVVTRWSKALSAGVTVLSGNDDNSLPLSYSPGYEQVFLNGVLLSRVNDYTATSGTSITLATASVAGDIVEVICALQISTTDTYTQSAADAKFVPKTLTTTTGDIIYASAANTPARLGIGSTSQVLTVSGGVPTWATPSSSGMTLLATTTLTGGSVTISSLSTYKQLLFVFRGARVASNSRVELRFNGDTTDVYSSQEFKAVNTTVSAGGGWVGAGTGLLCRIGDSATTVNLLQGNLVVNATDQTSGVSYFCTAGFNDGTGNTSTLITGRYANSAVISSATFIAVGTTFSSGTVLTYGVN